MSEVDFINEAPEDAHKNKIEQKSKYEELNSHQVDWMYIVSNKGDKPEDNADVTNNHTANDTDNINGKASSEIKQRASYFSPSDNMLDNPDFELGSDGWDFDSGSISVVSTSDTKYGGKVADCVGDSKLTGSAEHYIPIDTDKVYYGEVWIKQKTNSSGDNSFYAGIRNRDYQKNETSAGQSHSRTYFLASNETPTESDGWVKYDGFIGGDSSNSFADDAQYAEPYILTNYDESDGETYIAFFRFTAIGGAIKFQEATAHGNSTITVGDADLDYGLVMSNYNDLNSVTIKAGNGKGSFGSITSSVAYDSGPFLEADMSNNANKKGIVINRENDAPDAEGDKATYVKGWIDQKFIGQGYQDVYDDFLKLSAEYFESGYSYKGTVLDIDFNDEDDFNGKYAKVLNFPKKPSLTLGQSVEINGMGHIRTDCKKWHQDFTDAGYHQDLSNTPITSAYFTSGGSNNWITEVGFNNQRFLSIETDDSTAGDDVYVEQKHPIARADKEVNFSFEFIISPITDSAHTYANVGIRDDDYPDDTMYFRKKAGDDTVYFVTEDGGTETESSTTGSWDRQDWEKFRIQLYEDDDFRIWLGGFEETDEVSGHNVPVTKPRFRFYAKTTSAGNASSIALLHPTIYYDMGTDDYIN